MVCTMFIIIMEFIVFFIPHHHFSHFLLILHCVSLFLITPQSFSSLFSIFRVIQHHASSFFMLFIMIHPFSLFIVVHSCQHFFIIFMVFITFHDFPSSCILLCFHEVFLDPCVHFIDPPNRAGYSIQAPKSSMSADPDFFMFV